MARIPFFPIFWRSFFIQACWNYPRMLGVGFMYCVQPAARLIFPDAPGRIEFLKRHARWFNAQPYCSSLALGYVLRREQDLAQTGVQASPEARAELLKTKEDLCGMLGLIGDQIFWQLLKPEAGALGMTVALIITLVAGGFGAIPALFGIILFLLVFNSLHFWMRWWGLKTGYRTGEDLPATLAAGVIPSLRRLLASAGIYMALILVLTAFTFARRQFGDGGWIAFILGFISMSSMLKIQMPLQLALLIVALLCLLPVLLGLS